MKKLVLALAAAGVLALGAIAGVSAQAPKPQAQSQTPFVDALASKLGKTPDELRAAIVAAQREVVARAVQEGRVTQAQADKLNQRLEQGKGAGALRAPKLPSRPTFKLNPAAELATFLGMTLGDVSAELRAGKSLAEVAVARGKSRDDLKGFVNARIDRAVQDGQLTTQQATKLKGRVDQLIDAKRPSKPAKPTRAARV